MAGGVPPDPAQGAALVHVATRTQVTRLSVGETQVVRKQPLGPDARQRLEHERAMLKRLRGVRESRSSWTRRSTPDRSCWPTPARPPSPTGRSRFPSTNSSSWRWSWPGRWPGCTTAG